jgi:hypothetical protein
LLSCAAKTLTLTPWYFECLIYEKYITMFSGIAYFTIRGQMYSETKLRVQSKVNLKYCSEAFMLNK